MNRRGFFGAIAGLAAACIAPAAVAKPDGFKILFTQRLGKGSGFKTILTEDYGPNAKQWVAFGNAQIDTALGGWRR